MCVCEQSLMFYHHGNERTKDELLEAYGVHLTFEEWFVQSA